MLRMMMLRRRTDGRTRTHTLRKSSQSKCTWTFPKSHFMRKFTVKMPGPKTGDHSLCEPAQSKCTWTFHNSHFARKFRGKTPPTSTGLYTYREIPSVWTHCLENELQLQRHCWGLETCREHITSFIGSSGSPQNVSRLKQSLHAEGQLSYRAKKDRGSWWKCLGA